MKTKLLLLSLYYKLKTIYQAREQTFYYNNVNCNDLIKIFRKKYQRITVFQKINIQLKFIQKNN